MLTSKKTVSLFSALNQKVMDASYYVSLRIAKAGKPHTDGETLILPCVKDIVQYLFTEKEVKVLEKIPLSDSTVCSRIADMALDVKEQVIKELQPARYFAIQMDETTDVVNIAQLMAFVRYEADGCIQEEFLFCLPLSTRTTAAEIFRVTDEFMSEKSVLWEKCIAFCSDGASQ